MVNDKERCEVAAKLRKEAEQYTAGFDPLKLIEHLGIDVNNEPFFDGWHKYPELIAFETWNRLANLIEPKPERTCTWTWNVEEGYWDCSNCGEISPEDYHKIPNYCPDCGVRIVKKNY